MRHITVSIGLASSEEHDQEMELFTRADQAMYEVKRRGGNGIALWQSDFDTGSGSNSSSPSSV